MTFSNVHIPETEWNFFSLQKYWVSTWGQLYNPAELDCWASLINLVIYLRVLFIWSGLFFFFLVYWHKVFSKHTSAAIIPHLITYLMLHRKERTRSLQRLYSPFSSAELTAKPGNQMLVSCQGRHARWTTFVSSHSDRNMSPRWKDVKVNSPQEHSDNRRGKTSRVKTLTWNRTLCCHSHLSGCNLGVALHFFSCGVGAGGDWCVGWRMWRSFSHWQDVCLHLILLVFSSA